jgi:anti-sigma factor RsiW
MTCEEARELLHALVDGELDAGHARQVEAHVAGCARCAAALRGHRQLREALAAPALRFEAPAALRRKIKSALPKSRAASTDRRTLLKGFAMGTALSAIAATGVVVMVLRGNEEDRALGEVLSAHLRSLQAEHLTDVLSTDQHTVKPWFNGRIDLSPPVVDLTAQGFTLIGGRLDTIDGRPVAAIVYKRRAHVINLFVAPGPPPIASRVTSTQGFNIRRWGDQGLDLTAVSDINADELQEFAEKFAAGLRSGA